MRYRIGAATAATISLGNRIIELTRARSANGDRMPCSLSDGLGDGSAHVACAQDSDVMCSHDIAFQ